MHSDAVAAPTRLPDGTQSSCGVTQWRPDSQELLDDNVIEEMPIALVYNGISHAVMLASPADIEDFAVGFSLTEGVVRCAGEVHDIEVVSCGIGSEVQLTIASQRMAALKERRRLLAGRTGCGLCGLENLQQLVRPVPTVPHGGVLSAPVLDAAIVHLVAHQALHRSTGAAHAAAFVRWSGEMLLLREDVGRHNALDKLIGAIARSKFDRGEGFALVTSRASYEMVHKTAVAGIRLLAAISAPTAMAVRTATQAGMTLVGFAGRSRRLVYAHPQRVRPARSQRPAEQGHSMAPILQPEHSPRSERRVD